MRIQMGHFIEGGDILKWDDESFMDASFRCLDNDLDKSHNPVEEASYLLALNIQVSRMVAMWTHNDNQLEHLHGIESELFKGTKSINCFDHLDKIHIRVIAN